MIEQPIKKSHLQTSLLAAIGLLLIILLAMIIWFGVGVRGMYRNGIFSSASSRFNRRMMNRPTVTVEQVQGWMTFRYINYVFRLPPNYLADKLNIQSAINLNLTLNQYAKNQKLDSTKFLQTVKDAITTYQTSTK